MEARIYRGRITHARQAPARHVFTYPIWMLCIRLSDLPAADIEVAGFGHNRRGLCSIQERDHLQPGAASLSDKLASCARAAGVSATGWAGDADVWYLGTPDVLFRGMRPLCLFVRTGAAGEITGVVAEVRNTYGQTHAYVLPAPGCESKRERGCVSFEWPKQFFVSPFNGRDGRYRLSISEPPCADSLSVRFELEEGGRRVLSAGLALEGRPFNTRSLLWTLACHPLDAVLTLPRIVWQALLLRWLRGLKPRLRPRPASALTVRTGRKESGR